VLALETGLQVRLLPESCSVVTLGNNVLDEVLYHARIHPEQRCNSLSEEQVQALHRQIRDVCTFAVKVNTDDSKFPDNWLFRYRWVNAAVFGVFGHDIDIAVIGQRKSPEGR
jgi:ribosomal protein S13